MRANCPQTTGQTDLLKESRLRVASFKVLQDLERLQTLGRWAVANHPCPTLRHPDSGTRAYEAKPDVSRRVGPLMDDVCPESDLDMECELDQSSIEVALSSLLR